MTKIGLNKINLVIYWYLMYFFSSCYFVLKATKSLVFFGSVERANAVCERCSENFYKSIWKAVVVEYFFTKNAQLQPETC